MMIRLEFRLLHAHFVPQIKCGDQGEYFSHCLMEIRERERDFLSSYIYSPSSLSVCSSGESSQCVHIAGTAERQQQPSAAAVGRRYEEGIRLGESCSSTLLTPNFPNSKSYFRSHHKSQVLYKTFGESLSRQFLLHFHTTRSEHNYPPATQAMDGRKKKRRAVVIIPSTTRRRPLSTSLSS